MGAHWKGLGFGSVTELVNLARRNVAGQVEIMARFIERDAALLTALRKADWPAFARGYNGANYAKNAYDTKMAKAAAAWTKKLAAEPAPPPPKPVIVTAAPEPPPTKPPPALQPATKPAEAVKDESAGFFAALAAFLARIFRR
jgi:hypothetical protein